MRITDVTVTVWEWKDIPATRYTRTIASSKSRQTQMGLVHITTDEGVDGYGFIGSALASAKNTAPFIVEGLKPMLIGEDPFARERIWQTMMRRTRGQQMTAISVVDVALWDLAGRHAGVPVHRLMGSYRDSVPAYASSAVLDGPEAYADEAVRFKEAGWSAYKIHPPGDPDEDIRICRTVRSAVGDDYRLMLDSTWSYDYTQAVRVGVAIQELGFYWYEDPLFEDDIYSYVKLKQQLHIPIMATELPLAGPTSYAPWIMEQATDYLRGDVYLKGGLTSCLKTAHLAEAFHMTYEVHHGSNSLNNVANLHLIMAIPNCEYFEVLLPDEAQKHGLVRDIEVDENGLVRAVNEPGLGAEIDFELIERNKIAELT
jgi:L-alanine-DL-glutamate epimerase-like enolase superfamily enzyme